MVRTAGLLGLLGVLIVTPAAHALIAQTPQVSLDTALDGAFSYNVIATAIGDQKHNRAEGQIRTTCGPNDVQSTHFIHDYDSPVLQVTTPTANVIMLAGYRCSIVVSWLVGGAGAPGETATSPPKVVDTTPVPVKPRFADDTKSTARATRDAARRLAAKNYARGLDQLAAIYSGVAAVAGQIAADPADPAFRKRVKIRPVAPAKTPAAEFGSAAPAFDSYLAAGNDALAAGIALITAIDKAQGATHASKRADRRKYERRQMLDAGAFARRYATALGTFRSRAGPAATALRSSGAPAADATVSASDWDAARDGLIITGAPADFTAELSRLHVPKYQRDTAGFDLATSGPLPGTLADDVDNAQNLYVLQNHAAAMRRWAKAIAKHPTAKAPA